MKRISTFLAIFVIFFASLAHADKDVLVKFEVKDASGAVIPGAEVSFADITPGASRTTGLRTDRNGVASPRLTPGTYDVTVKLAGFRTLTKRVSVTDSAGQTFAFELPIASCSPCVEVVSVMPSISLAIKPPSQPVKSGSSIPISIALTNASQQPIVIYMDRSLKGELSGYRVFLSDESGKEGKKTDYQRLLKGEPTSTMMVLRTSEFPVLIQPGKSLVLSIDVSELYDLDSPGTYLIYVEREDPVMKFLIRSDSQKLQVIQ